MPGANRKTEATHYLNVDLDLVAKADLSPLLRRLEKSVVVLQDRVERKVHTLSLELSRQAKDVDQAFLRFAALVEGLPRAERKLWDACRVRCLDIGIQSEAEPYSAHFALSEAAVASAAKISARIVITVYARE